MARPDNGCLVFVKLPLRFTRRENIYDKVLICGDTILFTFT